MAALRCEIGRASGVPPKIFDDLIRLAEQREAPRRRRHT